MDKKETGAEFLKFGIEIAIAGVLGKFLSWLSTKSIFMPKKDLDAWGVVLQTRVQPHIWKIALVIVIILCAQEFYLLHDKTVSDRELMPFEKYRRLAITMRISISIVCMIAELICRPITNGQILLSVLVGLIIYVFIGVFEKVNWLFGEILFHPILFVITVLLTSIGLFLVINACIVPVLMAVGIAFLVCFVLGAISKMPSGDYGYVGIMGLGDFFYYKYY